jgi:hypothetical protein
MNMLLANATVDGGCDLETPLTSNEQSTINNKASMAVSSSIYYIKELV